MMNYKYLRHLTTSAFLSLSFASACFAHAEVFSELSFEQAKQEARQNSKILLIDFTATWCPPCRMMEKTTWVDSDVQSWIKENAVAIQVDVDKDPKTSEALAIEAMPTIVLFTPESGAKEFGRQVGFMQPLDLLEWLKNAKSGKAAGESDSASISSQNDVFDRIAKAREFQTAGKNQEALEEYIWIWNNVKPNNANFEHVRTVMVPYEMLQLAGKYPAAKSKFIEMRDAAEKAEKRDDWMILNSVLKETDKTLDWFDKTKTDPKQIEIFKKHRSLLEPVLFAKCRWSDAARYLYPDPIAFVNELYKRARDMTKPRPDTEFKSDFDPFPSMIVLVYGAYIGANREDEAKKIAAECLRLDNTQAMQDSLNNMASATRKARDAQAAAKPGNAASKTDR